MKNQKIGTLLGTIILIIIAASAGVFLWKYEKEKDQSSTQFQFKNNPIDLKTSTSNEIQNKLDNANSQDFLIVKPTLLSNLSNWKTLTNKKDGFLIRYPSEFFVDETNDSITNYKQLNPHAVLRLSGGSGPEGIIGIGINKEAYPVYPIKLTTEVAYINYYKNYNDPTGLTENAQDVKIGKYIVLSDHIKGGPAGELREYFAFNKNNVYVITISEPGYSEYKDLIDRMLATFTLTN
jgi:flagellar basal body-associated protein FliL